MECEGVTGMVGYFVNSMNIGGSCGMSMGPDDVGHDLHIFSIRIDKHVFKSSDVISVKKML